MSDNVQVFLCVIGLIIGWAIVFNDPIWFMVPDKETVRILFGCLIISVVSMWRGSIAQRRMSE